MTPAPLQFGQAPSELALNSAGFTPLAFANALGIGSRRPVYVAGLLRREPRIAPCSTDTTPAPAGIDPCTSELLPEPATPVTTTSTREGCRRPHRAGCERSRPGSPARRWASHRLLECGPVVEMAAGEGAAGPQPLQDALEYHLPTGRPGAGAEVDDVVGDRDRVRLVLHDEHRVALVAQPQEQLVHPLDVVRVEPDGRLVEDVGDVAQARAEVPDHPYPLGLAPGE